MTSTDPEPSVSVSRTSTSAKPLELSAPGGFPGSRLLFHQYSVLLGIPDCSASSSHVSPCRSLRRIRALIFFGSRFFIPVAWTPENRKSRWASRNGYSHLTAMNGFRQTVFQPPERPQRLPPRAREFSPHGTEGKLEEWRVFAERSDSIDQPGVNSRGVGGCAGRS